MTYSNSNVENTTHAKWKMKIPEPDITRQNKHSRQQTRFVFLTKGMAPPPADSSKPALRRDRAMVGAEAAEAAEGEEEESGEAVEVALLEEDKLMAQFYRPRHLYDILLGLQQSENRRRFMTCLTVLYCLAISC